MPEAPAVCENRKSLFPLGYGFDPGGTGITVRFNLRSSLPVSWPCPACGGGGRQLGGVYTFFENSIELLQAHEGTVEELERFQGILRNAQDTGASAADIQAQAEQETPLLAPLVRKLLATRETRVEWVAWLVLLIATVGVLIDWAKGR